MAKANMILDRVSDLTEIFSGGRQATCEMPAHQRIDGKDQPIDDKDPGKEQMPLPSHR